MFLAVRVIIRARGANKKYLENMTDVFTMKFALLYEMEDVADRLLQD